MVPEFTHWQWVKVEYSPCFHIKNNLKFVAIVASYYDNIVGIKATNICILLCFEFIIYLQCITFSNGVSVLCCSVA